MPDNDTDTVRQDSDRHAPDIGPIPIRIQQNDAEPRYPIRIRIRIHNNANAAVRFKRANGTSMVLK
jgi:hypothetical protein